MNSGYLRLEGLSFETENRLTYEFDVLEEKL
jgi:hypothetical protein